VSLRVIRPLDPEIPDEKFDPDAFARDHGEEPPPDAPPLREERRLYRLADLANLKGAAEDGVISDGLLTRGGKMLIAAAAGAGKSTLVNHLAAALASGRPFLGRFTIDRPYRVLCITAEFVEAELASHGQALLGVFDGTAATENLIFWLETGLRLPRCYPELREVVRETRAEVVMIDPFMEFFEGESSDKPEHVQKVFGALDQLQKDETLAGTVVVHHMGVAGQRSAGSWKFDGWPSTSLQLEKVPGVPNDRMLVFEKVRAPGFGMREKLQIRLSEAGYLPIARDDRQPPAGAIAAQLVIRDAGGQLRRQDLIERLQATAHVTLRTATSYIGQAKQQGLIEGSDIGRETIYRLAGQVS
jgi:hypothetical protein